MSITTELSNIHPSSNSQVVSYGKILVDTNSCQVTYESQLINLHPKEYKLLLLFLKYPNHVLSAEIIINKLWNIDKSPTEGSIRSHIKGLRKAFKKIDNSVQIIETVHGLGYRLKPLKPEKSTHPILSPPLSVMKGFLQAKAIEYVVINEEFIIKYISPNLSDYCDYPEFIKVGLKAEKAFPEFVGIEAIFKKIIEKKQDNFELKNIARAANPNRPEYINLYVMREEAKTSDPLQGKFLFIFFEDASETMLYKQRIVQLENELYLRLEMDKNHTLKIQSRNVDTVTEYYSMCLG
ncbi:MAG TPA: winged helix-turn-helix domain-containing protein [Stenomitos sp.]